MKSRQKLLAFLLLCAISVGVSFQLFYQGNKAFGDGSGEKIYTHYNNYLIFKNSFYHLVEGKDLYIHYPEEQHDLYKYSPTFSLAMGAIGWLPDLAGLSLWNLINSLLLFFAVWALPWGLRPKLLLLLFVVVELVTSLQSAQSNALMAGLMLWGFVFLERGQVSAAVLSVLAAVFIKPFALVAFAIFLFYPGKLRMLAYGLGWTVVLLALPLLVVSPSKLIWLYQSWGSMMSQDEAATYGFSVMGWLHSWFGFSPSGMLLLLVGIVLFCLPYLRWKQSAHQGLRLLLLASVLIWVVIFNHKAESPTFIIAVAGVAIWFYYSRRNWLDIILLAGVFAFTILSPTDLFPRALRESLVTPYALKGVACIAVWLKLLWDQMTLDFQLEG